MWGIVVFAIFAASVAGMCWLGRYINRTIQSDRYSPYKKYYTVPMRPEAVRQVMKLDMAFDDWMGAYREDTDELIFWLRLGVGHERKYSFVLTDMGDFSILELRPFMFGMREEWPDTDVYVAKKLNGSPIPHELMEPRSDSSGKTDMES